MGLDEVVMQFFPNLLMPLLKL